MFSPDTFVMPDPESRARLAAACAPGFDTDVVRDAAQRLNLHWLGEVDPARVADYDVLFYWDAQGPGLQQTGRGAPGRVRVEFWSGKARHRRLHGGGAGQMVAKAVGVQKGFRPTVVDATAGLGQDAFVLAGLGCEVTLVERTPVIAAMLDWAVNHDPECDAPDIAGRMRVVQADGRHWLTALTTQPDVIYLDPMFPHRDKSAAVKKEMQLFRGVVGDDNDAAELLDIALQRAWARVVVKRPRKAPEIDGLPPAHRLEGESCRYDIYPLRRLAPRAPEKGGSDTQE